MKTKISTILLAFTALAVNIHAATPLPAPMPTFMDKDQMVHWNADQRSATKAVSSAQETPSQFYTGKPYVAEAGGYVYEYRTYNPEMNRWTCADPSGFPDGVNNRVCTGEPLSSLDPDGLTDITDTYSPASPASRKSTATVVIGSTTYNAQATITATPSTTPTLASGGTITIDGVTELVQPNDARDTPASSTNTVTLTVTKDANGNITVAGIPTNPLTNSGGASPEILDNTLTVTVAGNGSKDVTVNVLDAAVGSGSLAGLSVNVSMTITLE